ncbi:MAG: hypothetical protein GXY86_08080 [Firmicutes bacterium]|nr:hypothetical protein [Bacillota bacterium]
MMTDGANKLTSKAAMNQTASTQRKVTGDTAAGKLKIARSRGKSTTSALKLKSGKIDTVGQTKAAANAGTRGNISGAGKGNAGVSVIAQGTRKTPAQIAYSRPRGFSSAGQVKQCTVELEQALSKSGLKVKSIQVRGSAATGVSRKGGNFRMEAQNGLKPSDIDVGIEFSDTVQNITTSKNQLGFIHPDKMMKNFPELKAWSEKWSEILGREITPGGWQPGTLQSDPSNIHLK